MSYELENNVSDSPGIKLLTRLRLGLSHLRQHKFNHNFQDTINPLCPCSLESVRLKTATRRRKRNAIRKANVKRFALHANLINKPVITSLKNMLRWLARLIWNWFLRIHLFVIGNTNQVIQNPKLKLRQRSIKKPGFLLSEKLETLTSSNYHRG